MLQTSSYVITRGVICAIGVCTRGRPASFAKCLRSLMALDQPRNVQIEIVVIDNENAPKYATLIADLNKAPLLHKIHYTHEARRGIVHARNAVLDRAEQLGAHWIAMIDDDQTASPDWLSRMFDAVHETGGNVIQSSVELAYPSPLPRWAFPREKRFTWKIGRKSAITCGVMFASDLLYYNGQRNRFNDKYNLTGGEDREFFRRLFAQGALICKTPNARLTEHLQASKLSFHSQLFRRFAGELIDTKQRREIGGMAGALVSKGIKAIYSILSGIALGLLVPAFALSPKRRDKQILKTARSFVRAAGIAYGLFGRGAPPQPYNRIHS